MKAQVFSRSGTGRVWNDNLWQVCKSKMKPQQTVSFNVHEAEDWRNVWCPPPPPDGHRPAEAWRAYAQGRPKLRSTADTDWLPTVEEFIAAVSETDGGARFDGWSAHEAKVWASFGLFLIHELFSLLA